MKRISIPALTLTAMLLTSACGGGSTPTMDPVDFQNTTVASALTILAQTQAAIPTETPVPPTATATLIPSPTNTFIPVPTEGLDATPNAAASDPCVEKLLPDVLTGIKIKIRIDNPTKSTINLSVYLQSNTAQGLCGYRAYVLGPQDSLVINDLIEGCYSLWAWNPEPKDYFMVTNGTSCLNSASNSTFDITPNGIKLR